MFAQHEANAKIMLEAMIKMKSTHSDVLQTQTHFCDLPARQSRSADVGLITKHASDTSLHDNEYDDYDDDDKESN